MKALSILAGGLLLAACASTPPFEPQVARPTVVEPVVVAPPVVLPVKRPPPKIALALGGGAAKGFAHIGVIKVLEAQGLVPDIVVGTSAGSVVGALYAGGRNGFELQELAMKLNESDVTDKVFPPWRGWVKGEALQSFINKEIRQLPLERLARTFGVVATDLKSGEAVLFRTGNVGMAVRASSSVPGVFLPVSINDREYVDGGLVSPVPVVFARSMGADLVIAVDISGKPRHSKTEDVIDILMQSFTIMGHALGKLELRQADIVVQPEILTLSASSFDDRHRAVLEGEKAAAKMMPDIRAWLSRWADGK